MQNNEDRTGVDVGCNLIFYNHTWRNNYPIYTESSTKKLCALTDFYSVVNNKDLQKVLQQINSIFGKLVCSAQSTVSSYQHYRRVKFEFNPCFSQHLRKHWNSLNTPSWSWRLNIDSRMMASTLSTMLIRGARVHVVIARFLFSRWRWQSRTWLEHFWLC